MNAPKTPWVLTGAIGTGKSTVGSILAVHGARVVDADRIGHAVIEPDGPAFQAVSTAWPLVVVDGRVDRAALGKIVFSDPDELRRLESITHPRIVERLEQFVSGGAGAVTVVEVSVPHLELDSSWPRIVVTAPPDVRRLRLQQRGMDPSDIKVRMAAQPAAEDWVRAGDVVVDNSGGFGALEKQVDRIWALLSNR